MEHFITRRLAKRELEALEQDPDLPPYIGDRILTWPTQEWRRREERARMAAEWDGKMNITDLDVAF